MLPPELCARCWGRKGEGGGGRGTCAGSHPGRSHTQAGEKHQQHPSKLSGPRCASCLLDCVEDTFSGFLLREHRCSAQTQRTLTNHNSATRATQHWAWYQLCPDTCSTFSCTAGAGHRATDPLFTSCCCLWAAVEAECALTRAHKTPLFTKYILKVHEHQVVFCICNSVRKKPLAKRWIKGTNQTHWRLGNNLICKWTHNKN